MEWLVILWVLGAIVAGTCGVLMVVEPIDDYERVLGIRLILTALFFPVAALVWLFFLVKTALTGKLPKDWRV